MRIRHSWCVFISLYVIYYSTTKLEFGAGSLSLDARTMSTTFAPILSTLFMLLFTLAHFPFVRFNFQRPYRCHNDFISAQMVRSIALCLLQSVYCWPPLCMATTCECMRCNTKRVTIWNNRTLFSFIQCDDDSITTTTTTAHTRVGENVLCIDDISIQQWSFCPSTGRAISLFRPRTAHSVGSSISRGHFHNL